MSQIIDLSPLLTLFITPQLTPFLVCFYYIGIDEEIGQFNIIRREQLVCDLRHVLHRLVAGQMHGAFESYCEQSFGEGGIGDAVVDEEVEVETDFVVDVLDGEYFFHHEVISGE